MSFFQDLSTKAYVEKLRKFLGEKREGFLEKYGFVSAAAKARRQKRLAEGQQRLGRLPEYPDTALPALEAKVNEKAALADANNTTLGQRYHVARDFMELNDSEVSRRMGVSRELVRKWADDTFVPKDIDRLCEVLNVPRAWLELGDAASLPANSRIGVRVGDEAKHWREELYARTLKIIDEIPDSTDESYFRAYLEWAVHNKPALKQAARFAGGRWTMVGGEDTFFFAPWEPVPMPEMKRRYWSDEVETLIEACLAESPSVYGAWSLLEQRCKERGLSEDEFPKRISLMKRVQKESQHVEEFGLDLNEVIASAVNAHLKQ